MSVQLIAWALDQDLDSPTDKFVLVTLCNAANHHTGQCNPRIDRLAKETALGESTVRRSLASLADKGLICRERSRRSDGSLGTYHYSFPHLLAARTPPLAPSASPPLAPSGLVEPEVVLEPEEHLIAPAARARNGTAHRPRNEIWDALGEIFGEPTTRSAQKVRGKVCASLRSARASPQEIESRARRWPLYFDTAILTDLALEKHWDTLGRKPLRRQG